MDNRGWRQLPGDFARTLILKKILRLSESALLKQRFLFAMFPKLEEQVDQCQRLMSSRMPDRTDPRGM